MNSYKEIINSIINELNERCVSLCDKYTVSESLKESMVYSLSGKSKRMRPLIVLLMLIDKGYENYKSAIDLSLALEFVHTYSLIHDDLPCMDNSNYRRGRLTNHKVYGETLATLAGDALLTESFSLICDSDVEDSIKVKCVRALSNLAGANGMVAGQVLDINNHLAQSIEEINLINYHKTHDMFLASLLFGSYILKFNDDEIKTIEEIAYNFGLSFQIKDDIDDIVKSEEELGKDSNNDLQNNKMTYPRCYGLEKSYEILREYENKTLELIDKLFGQKCLYSLIKEYYSK